MKSVVIFISAYLVLFLAMRGIEMTPKQAKFFADLDNYNIHRYDDSKCIYKYVDPETAKVILKDCGLKFSTPTELRDNDMELCLLNINLNVKQVMEKRIAGLMGALMNHGHYTHKQAKDYVKGKEGKFFLASMSTDKYKDVIKQSYGSMHEVYKLFCATTSNCNSKMWAKYAKDDTGFCIEYKFPTFFTSEYTAFKVFYDEKFEAFDFYDKNGKEDTVSVYRWFFTKRHRYAFEDEVRLITVKNRIENIYTFPKEIITGVYSGRHSSPQNIEEVEKLLTGYSFSKVVKAEY